MVRVLGIHHLALVTGSLDRTLRFWRDLIGLEVRSRLGAPGYRQYFLAAGVRTKDLPRGRERVLPRA